MLTTLKSPIRFYLQLIASLLLPKIKIDPDFKWKVLGDDDAHYFVGYYDFDPCAYSMDNILCHRVLAKYSHMTEPTTAEIGLVSMEDGVFQPITNTSALNWQLGSRVQWLTAETIIYNDVVGGIQCSKVFNVKTGRLEKQFDRPFWAISPNLKVAASLNFSRIKEKRPGYGYVGRNVDGDAEILTLFFLESGKSLFQISLKQLFKEIDFEYLPGTDPYLNHIAWSPCSSKFLTIFHFEESEAMPRQIFPVLIDCESHQCTLIHSSGYFSHHVWVDSQQLLAYIEQDGEKCFSVWTEKLGWEKAGDSLPQLDGHPSVVSGSNSIVVDSYPNRLGIMSLYLGSIQGKSDLNKIGTVMNPVAFKGALRCDLHPRVSRDNTLVICDVPFKDGRKVMVIEGAFDDK